MGCFTAGWCGMLSGNWLPISPRSVHVARLRESFVAFGLKYTICRVERPELPSLSQVRAAPSMGRGCPLAELMENDVGMRSWAERPSPFWRAGPARKL